MVAWWNGLCDFSGLGQFFIWLGGALYTLRYFLGEWGPSENSSPLLAGAYALWRSARTRVLVLLGFPILLVFGATALHASLMAHYGGNRLMLSAPPCSP